MAHSDDRPLIFFSLVPKNERAEAVIANPENSHFVSVAPDGSPRFEVGLPMRGKSSTTLLTCGRGTDVDIYVEGSNISKMQCSFELDLETGIVMFYDRSHGLTSQVHGTNCTPFEPRHIRKVVVSKNINKLIGMGGETRDLIMFELEWHLDFRGAAKTVKQYGGLPGAHRQHLRSARTVDEMPTELPSYRETRLHTPGPAMPKMRYIDLGVLGSGAFGSVSRAIDVDSGKVMAVKVIKRPENSSNEPQLIKTIQSSLKREIEILSSLSHPNIVDYLGSQGWYENDIEIFMGLKEGTLGSLVQTKDMTVNFVDKVLQQMLQALDCLAFKDIVHRDVKPENILYTVTPEGSYLFQLGDFGVSNYRQRATTCTGSLMYMAPEVLSNGVQSSKADIWSLFVTIVWTLDINGIRSTGSENVMETRAAVWGAPPGTNMSQIAEMAAIDPIKRASAAQMLVKLYHGAGLSTARDQVPPLEPVPAQPSLTLDTTDRSASNVRSAAASPGQLRGRALLRQRIQSPVYNGGIRKRGRVGQLVSPNLPMINSKFSALEMGPPGPRGRPS